MTKNSERAIDAKLELYVVLFGALGSIVHFVQRFHLFFCLSANKL